MIEESTRQFDLYDIIGVMLPGGVLIIGLLPFLPNSAPIGSTSFIAFLIIFSFVVGRAIHALGLFLENPLQEDEVPSFWGISVYESNVSETHRQKFCNELVEPDSISTALANKFLEIANSRYELDSLPNSREDLSYEHENELKSLYTLVRSAIHMDSRGRSRSFQAVLDFQRSTTVSVLILFIIYFIYSYIEIFGIAPDGLVGFTSFYGSFNIHPGILSYASSFILIVTFQTLWKARSKYREYYIQYIVSDFINMGGE